MVKLKRLNRTKVILSALLIASVLGNAALLLRAWWTNQRWEMAIYGMSSFAGALQAHADFRNGVRRQYELSTDGKVEYTRRNDGPFEVWKWPYYPDSSVLGHGDAFGNDSFVQTYNAKMKAMNEHPERFTPGSDGGHSLATQPKKHAVSPVLITNWNESDAAVGQRVRVEGVVTNSKQAQIDGIDIEASYDSGDSKVTDLRDQPAWAEGIVIRHVVTPAQVDNFIQNRGAGTFYELLDPFTGQMAIAHPLQHAP